MRKAFRQFVPLRESGSPRSAPTRGGRVFKDVTIIKAGLGNRKDRNYYPPQVLKDAAESGQFEGLRAFADHPDAISEESRPERSIRDIVGAYTNTRYQESGGGRVTGDLRVLKSSRWLSDMVDELVEMGHATNIGISINGRGETEPKRIRLAESGEEIDANVLQKFIDLKSADVVTEAGAGGGFQQLLESARSAKESGMKFTKKEIKALREAAAKGDKTALDKLAAAAEAAVTEAEETPKKGKDGKDGKDTKEAKDVKKKKKPAAEDTETEEASDPEGELDAAADEIISAGDGDTVESDDDAEGDADSDADIDESDEDADAESDVEEADDDDEDEAEGDAVAAEAAAAGKNGKKTKEASKLVAKKKTKDVKGVPGSGGGSMTKRAGAVMKKGQKYGGGPTREAQLEDQLRREKVRTARLAEALRVRQQTDRARKLLRESQVPARMRPALLHRMVGMTEQDMAREIRFTQTLLESARSGDEHDDFDLIEGAGSSMREVRGRARGGDDDSDTIDALLAESGVPLREATDGESDDTE